MERTEVIDTAIETIASLAGEWEYSGSLGADTRLVGDLAMRSLDIVVLSSAMVRKYGVIPFDQLYARMEAMPPEDRDLTLGAFADFVCEHLASTQPDGRDELESRPSLR